MKEKTPTKGDGVHYYALGEGDKCPKCEIGKGLRKASALELMLTGWENYEFLHCDTCGANFVGKGGEWMYMKYQIPKGDE